MGSPHAAIQKTLEENEALITAITNHQRVGALEEASLLQETLHTNLVELGRHMANLQAQAIATSAAAAAAATAPPPATTTTTRPRSKRDTKRSKRKM